MKSERRMANLSFCLMCLEFCFRDRFLAPERMLQAAGLRTGMTVLDFGCGPGSFSLAAARITGSKGLVYAIDNHPLALKSVRRRMKRQGLTNIRPLFGEEIANVPQAHVDFILLYDVLHDLLEPQSILKELQRVLKPDGVLSVRDHHLAKTHLVSAVTSGVLFLFEGCDRGTIRFGKAS